jgi:hypothetical protein
MVKTGLPNKKEKNQQSKLFLKETEEREKQNRTAVSTQNNPNQHGGGHPPHNNLSLPDRPSKPRTSNPDPKRPHAAKRTAHRPDNPPRGFASLDELNCSCLAPGLVRDAVRSRAERCLGISGCGARRLRWRLDLRRAWRGRVYVRVGCTGAGFCAAGLDWTGFRHAGLVYARLSIVRRVEWVGRVWALFRSEVWVWCGMVGVWFWCRHFCAFRVI